MLLTVIQKCGHAKGKARFRANSVVTRSVELNVDIVKGHRTQITNVRKLFMGGNYSRTETILGNKVFITGLY